MNFQQLRSVREAVRQGFNLTSVAEHLNTSQPGVSRQIRELEDELGIELFVRAHLEKEFAKLQTKSALKIENLSDGKPWVASIDHWNYQAAERATKARHPSLACAVLWS